MSRRIAFIGGDSQVGTTMIAQAVAETLGNRGAKVLLIFASGKYGNDFIANKEDKSIDDIKANLINGHLDRYELGQTLVTENGIWMLPGVRDSVSASYFTENVMDTIVDTASDFDYVIMDCGDDMGMGLVMSSVNVCNERYFVITQQEKTLRRFKYMKRRVFDALNIGGRLMINKYQANVSLLSARDIEKMLAIDVVSKVPYIEYGWQAEIERETLKKSVKFARAVDVCTDEITGECREERSWIRNLIWKNI